MNWEEIMTQRDVSLFSKDEAVTRQKECSQSLGTPVEMTNSIGMKLVLIPPGEFLMGSPETEEDRYDNEHQHLVRITKPFYLGVHEVTQAEYEKVMGANPSYFEGASNPVEYVSWGDATGFCKRLSAKEGKTYRLPTEAEWEYACRAGTTTRYSFGDDAARLGEYAWYYDNSRQQSHPVGEKKPDVWGLHGMHGSVWEWCADWYDRDYYAGSPMDDPPGPETGKFRVFRGGYWWHHAKYCRAAYRYGGEPHFQSNILGFRVAAVLPNKSGQEQEDKKAEPSPRVP